MATTSWISPPAPLNPRLWTLQIPKCRTSHSRSSLRCSPISAMWGGSCNYPGHYEDREQRAGAELIKSTRQHKTPCHPNCRLKPLSITTVNHKVINMIFYDLLLPSDRLAHGHPNRSNPVSVLQDAEICLKQSNTLRQIPQLDRACER